MRLFAEMGYHAATNAMIAEAAGLTRGAMLYHFATREDLVEASIGHIEAARIRLRPILMTSLAFMAGVFPLAIATGAGANSRIAIGTAVIGGMLTATILAIFFIPLFFVLVRRGVRDGLAKLRGQPTGFRGGHDDDHDGDGAPAPAPEAS